MNMNTAIKNAAATAFDNRALAAMRHIDYLRATAEDYDHKASDPGTSTRMSEKYYEESKRLWAEADGIEKSWFPKDYDDDSERLWNE